MTAPTPKEPEVIADLRAYVAEYPDDFVPRDGGGEIRLRKILAAFDAMTAELDAAVQDAARLDWLEDNLAYLMLGTRISVRGKMEPLHSRGKGWNNGELRLAIDKAMNRTALTPAPRGGEG